MEPTADKLTCPSCGKSTPVSSHCAHCGAFLGHAGSHRLLSSEMPEADYGIFLLAIPVIAVAGLLILALAMHSIPGMLWLLGLTVVITAGLAAGEIFQSPSAWSTGNPLKQMFTWLGLILVLWPFGYPAYMRARHRYKLGNWLLGALLVEAIFIGGAVLAGVITATGYGKPTPQMLAKQDKNTPLLVADPGWFPDPNDIYVVKTAHLDNCPGKTVEQEVNGFFASPRWKAGATAKGEDFVNVSGIVTYQGKPTTAVFQFLMFKDKSGFKFHAFTINNVPQSLYVAAFTLAEMCGS